MVGERRWGAGASQDPPLSGLPLHATDLSSVTSPAQPCLAVQRYWPLPSTPLDSGRGPFTVTPGKRRFRCIMVRTVDTENPCGGVCGSTRAVAKYARVRKVDHRVGKYVRLPPATVRSPPILYSKTGRPPLGRRPCLSTTSQTPLSRPETQQKQLLPPRAGLTPGLLQAFRPVSTLSAIYLFSGLALVLAHLFGLLLCSHVFDS
jgi:hypothetical protein